MGTWTSLSYPIESTLTSLKMSQMVDNLAAWTDGSSGAPKITETAIASGSIRQSKLNTELASITGSFSYGVAFRNLGGVTLNDFAFAPTFIYCATSKNIVFVNSSTRAFISPFADVRTVGGLPTVAFSKGGDATPVYKYQIDYRYLKQS